MESLKFWASIALSLLVAYLSLDIMGFFSRGNKFQVEGRVSHTFPLLYKRKND